MEKINLYDTEIFSMKKIHPSSRYQHPFFLLDFRFLWCFYFVAEYLHVDVVLIEAGVMRVSPWSLNPCA